MTKGTLTILKSIRKWRYRAGTEAGPNVFSATLTIASLSLIVRLVSTAKEMVVAGTLGSGDAVDAFLIAFLVPSYAISVVCGSFKAAFIPTYIRVKEQEGIDQARRLFASALTGGFLLMALATLPMVIAAPVYLPLIASGFSGEKLAFARHLLYLLSPVILLSGFTTIWGAILNAEGRFGVVALAPAITPLLVLAFLLLEGKRLGATAIAYGMVCGTTLEMTLIGYALRRGNISVLPGWHGFDDNLRMIAKQFLPMLAGAVLLCATDLIDQSMAAMLGPGSVSALSYGGKIVSVPLGLATMALGTAVIPYFSTMAARGEWVELRRAIHRCFLVIFITTVPATALLIGLSRPLVAILYQRGAFTPESTHLVAQIQSLLAIQIPFYLAAIVMVRLISVLLASHVLLVGNLINTLLCIGLNYLFMQRMGVCGIALSTSCVYMVSFFFLYFSYRRLSRGANSTCSMARPALEEARHG